MPFMKNGKRDYKRNYKPKQSKNECNRGLGYFRDNQSSLLNAARYLAEQEQSSEGG